MTVPDKTDPSGDEGPLHRIKVLWTLQKDTHVVTAEIWAITGVIGYDLRFTYDGTMRATQLFQGPMGGTQAVDVALAKRAELLAKGWTASA